MTRAPLTFLCIFLLSPLAANAGTTVAKIGAQEITLEDLEEHVKGELIELESRRYEILKTGLERLISQRLVSAEAAERKISVTELYAQEVHGKVIEPSEDELEALYEANKAELGDETFESIRPQLVNYLKRQQATVVLEKFLVSLRTKHGAKVLLKPHRIEVATGDQPSRGGGNDAAVTIVAFSDYECPFCKNGEAVAAQILAKYGDKIRYFHRDFPLSFHPNAHSAAEAARCAGDQGKFWAYHQALFASPQLSQELFSELAGNVGVDRAAFDECLASGRFKYAVDKDIEAGSDIGVNGTPSFFINGRALSGAQSLEDFQEIIDAELELRGN